MRFDVLDTLTLPGDPAKPNDDALAYGRASAVVMDGATGLGEPLLDGESDAAWVAHFGAERLMAHMALGGKSEDALREALRETEAEFVQLRRRIPKETYEVPFASMMFVTLDDGQLHASWFGDCAAFVQRSGDRIDVLGDAIAKRGRERERVAALAASLGSNAAGGGVREIFLPALRRARNTANTEKGGWLFGPEARAFEHVSRASVAAPAGTLVLLVTDGFLALASDYDRYNPESLFDAAHASGLALLGAELRAVEDADPDGKHFPRFKKSDDATAMLLRVTA